MKNGSHFSIFFSGIPTGLLPEIFIAKIYFLWEIRYNSDIDFHTKETVMQKSFIRHIFTVSILSCCLLFGGCSQNSAGDDTSSATTASTSPSETVAALPADVSPDSESSAIESTSEDTRALTLSVVNMCGIEVGMVAVIDPVTGEQVNLDSLSDQESISMEADWPSSVNEFQWALYNTDGELCVEGTTDISSAQATVTLLLTGDGDLEKVEELFE
jgi:hypothetical protein